MVTRAKVGISKPLARMNFHATTTSAIPRSHLHALRDPNWHKAMSKFAEEILERAHMKHCNLSKTLVDTESKLGSDGNPVSDPTYIAALQRILRYVRGTIDHEIQLHVSSTSQLTAYTDADWAGFLVTRRSTFGYCVFLGDNLLYWSAKWQVNRLKGCGLVVAEGVRRWGRGVAGFGGNYAGRDVQAVTTLAATNCLMAA
nr:ribonuclease H-like domain-containing protein [Tanacetum cinerariifolium]